MNRPVMPLARQAAACLDGPHAKPSARFAAAIGGGAAAARWSSDMYAARRVSS